jgi:hypothetical protein
VRTILRILVSRARSNRSGAGRAAARSPVRETPTANGAALQILLAEDNPVNQLLAVRLMEKEGYGNARAIPA